MGGGGGVWVISEKKILQNDSSEKKFLKGNTWRKQNSYIEKKSFMAHSSEKKFLLRFMSGKNSITRGLGKKIYPNQIKSQMVGVKVYNNVLTMTYEHHIRPVLNNILP